MPAVCVILFQAPTVKSPEDVRLAKLKLVAPPLPLLPAIFTSTPELTELTGSSSVPGNSKTCFFIRKGAVGSKPVSSGGLQPNIMDKEQIIVVSFRFMCFTFVAISKIKSNTQ